MNQCSKPVRYSLAVETAGPSRANTPAAPTQTTEAAPPRKQKRNKARVKALYEERRDKLRAVRAAYKAQKGGLKRSPWAPREIAYLVKQWGLKPVVTLAKNLSRSVGAVWHKARDLKLCDLNQGKLTLTEACDRLGISKKYLYKLVHGSGLELEHAIAQKPNGKAQRAARRFAIDEELFEALAESLRADLNALAAGKKCTRCGSFFSLRSKHEHCQACRREHLRYGTPGAPLFCNTCGLRGYFKHDEDTCGSMACRNIRRLRKLGASQLAFEFLSPALFAMQPASAPASAPAHTPALAAPVASKPRPSHAVNDAGKATLKAGKVAPHGHALGSIGLLFDLAG